MAATFATGDLRQHSPGNSGLRPVLEALVPASPSRPWPSGDSVWARFVYHVVRGRVRFAVDTLPWSRPCLKQAPRRRLRSFIESSSRRDRAAHPARSGPPCANVSRRRTSSVCTTTTNYFVIGYCPTERPSDADRVDCRTREWHWTVFHPRGGAARSEEATSWLGESNPVHSPRIRRRAETPRCRGADRRRDQSGETAASRPWGAENSSSAWSP